MATLLASSARSVDQMGSLASQLANCVDQDAGCLAGWPACVAGQPGPGHVGGWAPSAWRAGPAPRSGKRRRAVAEAAADRTFRVRCRGWGRIVPSNKKQSCESHSTPEAELVAGAFALRQEGIPVQIFFDETVGKLCGSAHGGAQARKKTLYFHADNTAMITCCKSGKSQTMRHMGRTHGISLQRMHDEIRKGYCELRYIDTAKMAADAFTKFFPQAKASVWTEVRKLVNVLSP